MRFNAGLSCAAASVAGAWPRSFPPCPPGAPSARSLLVAPAAELGAGPRSPFGGSAAPLWSRLLGLSSRLRPLLQLPSPVIAQQHLFALLCVFLYREGSVFALRECF